MADESIVLMHDHSVDEARYTRITKRAEFTSKALKFALWGTLVIGSILFAMPLYIMLVMSLKTPGEIATTPAWTWPHTVTWDNFKTVLTNENAPFILFFRNSLVIALASTLGVVISSALVAYPFARLRFRGRDRLFILLLSTMMLPGIVTMIPSYVMFAEIHWVDTFLPLTVPAFFGGGAFNIFLLRQFYMGIPRDLDEAALLDGASYATIFWRVIFPNSGAALATVGVFAFIYNWRDFMGPLQYGAAP